MAGALVQLAVLPSGLTTGDDSKIRGTWRRNGNASRIVITASLNSVRNSNRFLGSFPLRNQELKCHRGRTRSSRRKLCTVASFTRFTQQALVVIMKAQAEARWLRHNFVGKEMILLGLIGERTSRAAKALTSMGINLKDARAEVEKIVGKGSGYVDNVIPFTARAESVLGLALQEANQMGHKVGSEHLLLGLLREGEGVAARVLESLGADPNNISTQVVRMVGESTEAVGAGVGGGSSELRTNLTKLAEELIAEHLSEDETATSNKRFMSWRDNDNSGDAGAPESEDLF